jgi:trigger factor
MSGTSLDETRAELAPDAEMAIRRELVVEAVAEAENVVVTDEDIETQVRTDAVAAGRDADELMAELNKYGGVETLRDDMVMRKTVDLLIEHSTPIPVALKEARDQLWTPEKQKEAAGESGGLWTPDTPVKKKRTTKKADA